MKKAENIRIAEVRELLEKYFEAATSLDEEHALRDYFTNDADIPVDLQYARPIFGYFAGAAAESGRPAVHPAESLSAKTFSTGNRKKKSGRALLYYIAGAVSAAAVVIFTIILRPGAETLPTGEQVIYCYVNGQPVTDIELAMEYSERALAHISGSITAPMPRRPVFEGLDKFEQATQIIEKLAGSEPDNKQ